MKNAPLPWVESPAYVVDANGFPVAEVEFLTDYERDSQIRKRIVACVNACEGMEDPATEITELKEALRLYIKEYEQHGTGQMISKESFYLLAKLALNGGKP